MAEKVIQICKESSEEGEDRLSSLPDAILTDILSLLPIHSAAATSVLSHRWRHLWTTVTRLQFKALKGSDSTAVATVAHIFSQIATFQNLRYINLNFEELSRHLDFGLLSSYFREFSRQNVEEICIDSLHDRSVGYTLLPPYFFNSQFLVSLELYGMFKLKKPPKNLGFHLPNLKNLGLYYIVHIPSWLEILFRSCPLLEDLSLCVTLEKPLDEPSVSIFAPNLRSLFVHMEVVLVFPCTTERAKIFFDAPKLKNLHMDDCSSFYYFLQNPTNLVDAVIDLRTFVEYDEDDEVRDEGYLRHMSELIGRMSSVSDLKLMVDYDTNVFPYLNDRGDGFPPIFCNVVHLEAVFNDVVLFSLQCFPNLQHLKVDMTGHPPVAGSVWYAPNSVPDCLVSKLKTIEIGMVQGNRDELELLAYILRNANVLEKLQLHLGLEFSIDRKGVVRKAYAVREECRFFKSLFELPRGSSTCEIAVSGGSVSASGDALQNGYLTCQMYMGP